MAKVIMKNTKHDLVVKIAHLSGDGLQTGIINVSDGQYDGIDPIGYDIKSIRWTQKSNHQVHIVHGVSDFVLCGNGVWDFNKGMVDSSESADTITWAHDGTEFTIILELSKKY